MINFNLKKLTTKKKIDKTENLLNMDTIFFQLLHQHVFETIFMPSK